jgi:hypothetical protein
MSLKVLILGVRQRRFELLPTWSDCVELVCLSCTDHLVWLIVKAFSHFLVGPLHFRMGDGCQFAVARLVGCDLCRTSTFQAVGTFAAALGNDNVCLSVLAGCR